MIDQTIAHYKITAKPGQGGMGVVYRATDTKLDREVAIKVLPEAVCRDRNRLARFEREAKILAQLNHANIAGVHGLEQSGPIQALILELAEGEDLSERLKRGAMPIQEALIICRQIAEAVESAHEKGIIHRDLKPGNVKLTVDGKVKVLDFGLAKAWSGDRDESSISNGPDSVTITDAVTGPGVILGTAAYMSPEQARGREVDKRSDIWAFGCCVYEILTGSPAFKGTTATDILAQVIGGEPDWNAQPQGLPEPLRHLLSRCLEKDRSVRLRDIGEARIELSRGLDGKWPKPSTHASSSGFTSGNAKVAWVWSFVSVAVAVGAIAWSLLIARDRHSADSAQASRIAPRTPKTFKIPIPAEAPILLPGYRQSLAISPDGRKVAYCSGKGADFDEAVIHVMDLETNKSWFLKGSSGARSPFFSPDGEWICFFTSFAGLLKAPVDGLGKPVVLANVPPISSGGSWGMNDEIVFSPSPNGAIHGLFDGRRDVRPVTALDQRRREVGHTWPCLLTDGRGLLFTAATGEDFQVPETTAIAFQAPGSEAGVIIEDSRYARHLASGHLVFARGNALFARVFNPDDPEAVTPHVQVRSRVMSNAVDGVAQFAVSREGTIVYVEGPVRSLARRPGPGRLGGSLRHTVPDIAPPGGLRRTGVFPSRRTHRRGDDNRPSQRQHLDL